ncbi:hypothetical protein JNB62_02120 [Microbacterium jejuense]|uniref:CinA C-terminal domain-containing protein n=1 Tax=Microbacterium jejuense TaxID=1263637 RepID=A0ABS7HJ02_9MICO|nr:hypothetical protein [Microbacterium jejuense]MBW9092474.1 hypothetical protein [Microbacterium jejuense]
MDAAARGQSGFVVTCYGGVRAPGPNSLEGVRMRASAVAAAIERRIIRR